MTLPNDALKAVNVYVIESGDGLTLVDGGMSTPTAKTELSAALQSRGYTLDNVSQVLVTHVHRDHYTNAIALRRDIQCRVGLGSREHRALSLTMDFHRPRFAEQLSLLRLHGAAKIVDVMRAVPYGTPVPRDDWQEPDWWLDDGEHIDVGGRLLSTVGTPGHTRGHMVFADADNGVTFTGDHVLPTITPSIALEPEPRLDSLGSYLDSLKLMTTRRDTLLLPAHGPVAASVHDRATQLLDHHENRLQEVAKAIQAHHTQALEIALTLTWTRHHVAMTALNTFNQMLAVLEVVFHLEELVTRGLARRSTRMHADGEEAGYER